MGSQFWQRVRCAMRRKAERLRVWQPVRHRTKANDGSKTQKRRVRVLGRAMLERKLKMVTLKRLILIETILLAVLAGFVAAQIGYWMTQAQR